MVKIVGFFWLFVLILAIAGFIWLGMIDVPIEAQNAVIEIPVQDVIN